MAITNETLEVKCGTETCQHASTHFVLHIICKSTITKMAKDVKIEGCNWQI